MKHGLRLLGITVSATRDSTPDRAPGCEAGVCERLRGGDQREEALRGGLQLRGALGGELDLGNVCFHSVSTAWTRYWHSSYVASNIVFAIISLFVLGFVRVSSRSLLFRKN